MIINSTRFGTLECQADDMILFPHGLLGLEECRQWFLLTDARNEAIAWLQSVERPEIALAVTYPRRYAPRYQMRISRHEIAPLNLSDSKKAEVLTIVGKTEESLTINLKAPLIINPECRLGRQVITNGDDPLRYEVATTTPVRKKIA